MKLLIDNREPPAIIKYLNVINESSKNKIIIEICTLDLRDHIFYHEKSETNIVIYIYIYAESFTVGWRFRL